MFERKDEITEAVDAVYDLTRELGRGQILTHAAIRGVLGVGPHQGCWDHVVGKVRKRLQEERGIATWPEHTVGYKLCTPDEQLNLPAERLRRGIRQVRRGRKSVEALPEKSLTLHQRRARLFFSERMRETERGLRRELRAQAEPPRATETLPRRPAAV